MESDKINIMVKTKYIVMLNHLNLYGNEWLDVVFRNRNKNYGAYTLRSQSSSMLLKSLFIAGLLFILLFVGPLVYRKIFPPVVTARAIQVVIDISNPIHEIKQEEPEKEKIKAELPKAMPKKQELKSVKFSVPVVVKQVLADPPTTNEVNTSVIAGITQEGLESIGNVPLTAGVSEGGEGLGISTGNGNEIYHTSGVESHPEFPGGMAAWAKFIQRNLKYPVAAQDNGAQGKVFLSFVVEKDGSITNVEVIKGIGYGCDEEAMRVIKKSPRWKAGIQNNQPVRVRYTMPIGYVLN